MIVAIVICELIVCFIFALLIGAGYGPAGVPFAIGLSCASFQLIIHYLPPHRNARRGLLLAVATMLLFGALAEGFDFYPYGHQALLIAAVGTLPQIWLEWSSIRKWRKLLLLIAGLLAIPLGYEVWSYANIGIVKLKAQSVAQGESYCILLSNGNPFYRGYYHVAPDNLSLAGSNMVAPHGVGGSGDCCQWDFHALLLTKNDQMFNWSYNSQRFDRLSAKTRRDLGIAKLNCP